MACNTERANCSPEDIMAAAGLGCSKFIGGDNFQAEQHVFDLAYRDLINGHGIEIAYYVNTFTLSSANLLYGEDPTAVYTDAINMQMYVELSQDALALSQFGFDPGDEFTGFVHIETFKNQLSAEAYYATQGALSAVEPKSGDLIEVTPLGCDRPDGRSAKIYEITERVDEDISSINPMLGHYVYRVRAKRYEPSFEPNAPQEGRNEQVYDGSQFGVLSSNIQQMLSADVSEAKAYDYDIDTVSKTDVYDMDQNDTDIYGGYY
tara:strand:- start:2577 stop:3365 length:789 start_codon:yes stop_codon:yes gene_type:complete